MLYGVPVAVPVEVVSSVEVVVVLGDPELETAVVGEFDVVVELLACVEARWSSWW